MKLEEGKIWETVDGNVALIVFAEGQCLVAQNISEPQWLVCSLPASMSNELRAREGDLSIEEVRKGDDIAIVVTINGAMLAYCSTPEARKFLVREPEMIFTA